MQTHLKSYQTPFVLKKHTLAKLCPQLSTTIISNITKVKTQTFKYPIHQTVPKTNPDNKFFLPPTYSLVPLYQSVKSNPLQLSSGYKHSPLSQLFDTPRSDPQIHNTTPKPQNQIQCSKQNPTYSLLKISIFKGFDENPDDEIQ